MKAYQVSNYEGYGEIVFADTPGQAKARTLELDDDFVELSVRRAPDFDQYENQEITPEILLAHGWFWECFECSRSVYEEDAKIIGGKVYCKSHFDVTQEIPE